LNTHFLNQSGIKIALERYSNSKSLNSFYILGLLNGLLPCGLVYFFAVSAASTGSAVWGAVVMLIFGLSTIPALFSLGVFTSYFTETNFQKNYDEFSLNCCSLFMDFILSIEVMTFIKQSK